MVVTQYFKIEPGKYVKTQAMNWFGTWWWAIVLPLVALIVAGSYDLRFYIVALALIFLVYPTMLMIVYFNYALSPQAAMSVIPHRLVFGTDRITIEYQPSEERPTPKPRIIAKSEISSVEDTGKSLMLHLKSGKYDTIEIPAAAISPKVFTKILEMLN